MRSGLRRCGVFTAFAVVLLVLLVVADPASAGQDKNKGGHGPKAAGGSNEPPPGLVGNVHAQAKGKEAKADEAPDAVVDSGPLDTVVEPEASPPKADARHKEQAQGGGGGSNNSKSRSSEAHHHVIVCHRTGSVSNPYVVINIPWTAWSGAHSSESAHAHPALDGRVDVLLADPASRPGGKDGFAKSDCRGSTAVDPPGPPADPPADPPAPVDPPAGGSGSSLGTQGSSPGRGQLPFTGFPALVALLVGLGAAVGAAGIARGSSKKGQDL